VEVWRRVRVGEECERVELWKKVRLGGGVKVWRCVRVEECKSRGLGSVGV